jgi:hypothetical protein
LIWSFSFSLCLISMQNYYSYKKLVNITKIIYFYCLLLYCLSGKHKLLFSLLLSFLKMYFFFILIKLFFSQLKNLYLYFILYQYIPLLLEANFPLIIFSEYHSSGNYPNYLLILKVIIFIKKYSEDTEFVHY